MSEIVISKSALEREVDELLEAYGRRLSRWYFGGVIEGEEVRVSLTYRRQGNEEVPGFVCHLVIDDDDKGHRYYVLELGDGTVVTSEDFDAGVHEWPL